MDNNISSPFRSVPLNPKNDAPVKKPTGQESDSEKTTKKVIGTTGKKGSGKTSDILKGQIASTEKTQEFEAVFLGVADLAKKTASKARQQKKVKLDPSRLKWENGKRTVQGISGAMKVSYISKKGEEKVYVVKKGSVPYDPSFYNLESEPECATRAFREFMCAQVFRLFDSNMVPKTYLTSGKDGYLEVASRFKQNRLWSLKDLDPLNFTRMAFLSVLLWEEDFKPENILGLDDGKCMRIDFGHSMELFPDLKFMMENPLEHLDTWMRRNGWWGDDMKGFFQKEPEKAMAGIRGMITDFLVVADDDKALEDFFDKMVKGAEDKEYAQKLCDWMHNFIKARAAELKAALPENF